MLHYGFSSGVPVRAKPAKSISDGKTLQELQRESSSHISNTGSVSPGGIPIEWLNGTIQNIDVIHWLGSGLQTIFLGSRQIPWSDVEEIRLRAGQPLLLLAAGREIFVDSRGIPVEWGVAYRVTAQDVTESLDRMTNSSFYAVEEELKKGFLTLPGGHRVGVAGETILHNGQIQTLKNISSLNIRIAKDIPEQVTGIIPWLLGPDARVRHTVLLSPPRAGKTTLLRRLIRSFSDGVPGLRLRGQTVGVVDERGELAGMWQGTPAYNLGCRTDVIDGCPKSLGIGMLVRSMAPEIIAVDELGHPDDVAAVVDALRTGVTIISTAHAGSWQGALTRPTLRMLFDQGVFERVVLLSRRAGPGTVEGIYDVTSGRELTGRSTTSG